MKYTLEDIRTALKNSGIDMVQSLEMEHIIKLVEDALNKQFAERQAAWEEVLETLHTGKITVVLNSTMYFINIPAEAPGAYRVYISQVGGQSSTLYSKAQVLSLLADADNQAGIDWY